MNYEHTGNYYTLGHLSLFTGLTDRTLRTYTDIQLKTLRHSLEVFNMKINMRRDYVIF